jgi:Domain of unknown function (DUF4373)
MRGLLYFMGAKNKHIVSYFPFICREGETVFFIEDKYGNNGYATWVKILRQLAVTERHYLDLEKKTSMLFLAAKCKVSPELLTEIIEDLVEFGDFDKHLWNDRKVIYCQKFIDNIEDAYKRRSTYCIQLSDLCKHIAYNYPDTVYNLGQNVNNNPQSILDNSIIDNTRLDETIEENENPPPPIFKNDFPIHVHQKKIDSRNCEPEKEKILSDQIYVEHNCMKNGLTEIQLKENFAAFIKQNSAIHHFWENEQDLRKHFQNWLPKKLNIAKNGKLRPTAKPPSDGDFGKL